MLGRIRVRPDGRNLIRIIFKLPAIIALALCILPQARAQSTPTVKDGLVTGAGFTFTLPADLLAKPAYSDETLHGFYIPLAPTVGDKEAATLRRSSGRPSNYRYIAFDTRWDVGDMPSLDAVVQSVTSNILDNIPPEIVGPGDVLLDANLPVRLGTLPARRLVIKYRNTAKQPAIRQVIVAYYARKDASAIVYLLTLNTTEQNFREDVNIFSKVLAGFKLTGQ